MIPGSRFGQVMPQAERLIQTCDIAKEAVVLGGLSRHAAARRFGVSIASAVRWVTRLACDAARSSTLCSKGTSEWRILVEEESVDEYVVEQRKRRCWARAKHRFGGDKKTTS